MPSKCSCGNTTLRGKDKCLECCISEYSNKTKAKPKHYESKLQQSCVYWFRLSYPNLVLYAIPNGGYRKALEAKIMKTEGVLAGVADLFLMCANYKYHGLYIEVKYADGKQSDNQKIFEKKAKEFGYCYIVINSLESFIKEVNNYLKTAEHVL